MDQTAKPSLLTARIIAGSIVAGLVTFWFVAWWLARAAGARAAEDAAPAAELQFWIWAAAALVGMAGALFFRARAMQEVESRRTGSGPPSLESLARVQTNLVIAWALVEMPAIVAGVFVFLSRTTNIFAAAAPVFALGMALTFPRAAWFGEK